MMRLPLTALLAVAACGLTVAACAPNKPWLMERSNLAPRPIALVESRHIVKKPLTLVSAEDLAGAARVYAKNGAGPMYVVVAYKDNGKLSDSAVRAKSAALTAALQGHGIAARDIVSSTVPLETPEPVALIAFDTLEARGPQGCTDMPGLHGRMLDIDHGLDYTPGCSVKSVMAKQIADPRDLEGRAGLGGGYDGEHAANVITEQYKPGAPRDFLPSYVISELAGSGN